MYPKRKHRLLNEAEGGGTGGGAAGNPDAGSAPASSAAAPAPADAPAQAPAATTQAPAAAPSASPAPAPAGKAAPASPAAAPAAGDGKAANPNPDDKPGDWPADWRDKAAGGDEKLSKLMARYGSPADVAKALQAAQAKISSGELKPVLGKNATPEEIAEYRKAHGIPEDPSKYDLGDAKIEDADKPRIDGLLKTLHERNAPPELARDIVKSLYAMREQAATEQFEADERAKQSFEDSLRSEWGAEYRRNINLVNNLLDTTLAEGDRNALLFARMDNGMRVVDSPSVIKGLLSIALAQNPAGTLVPSAGADAGKHIDDEIAAIEKKMGTKEYIKDEALQARYRDLITARESLKQRAA